MMNLDSLFKSGDITADKGPYSQSYGFCGSHGMWELDHREDWAPKNWCFWSVVLGKTLESSLDSKEIKPVNPKGNQPEYSLEGPMLKLQSFGHLLWRAYSMEKTLMLGKTEGRRRRGWQRMRWLDGIINSVDMSLSKLQKIMKGREAACSPWGRKESDMTERLTTTKMFTESPPRACRCFKHWGCNSEQSRQNPGLCTVYIKIRGQRSPQKQTKTI